MCVRAKVVAYVFSVWSGLFLTFVMLRLRGGVVSRCVLLIVGTERDKLSEFRPCLL